jgi:hypothetical protein
VANGFLVGNAPGAAFAQALVFVGGDAEVGGVAFAPGAEFTQVLAFSGGAASGLIIGSASGGAFAGTIAFSGGLASTPGAGGTYTLPPVAIYVGHNIAIGIDGRPIYIQF